MYLTYKSRFKIIRVAGMLSMFIWFILAFPFVFIIPFFNFNRNFDRGRQTKALIVPNGLAMHT